MVKRLLVAALFALMPLAPAMAANGKTNTHEDAVLNWLKGTAMPTAPTAVYACLNNGDPTDTGVGGTDVTATIRPAGCVAITFGSITVANGGADSMCNSAPVDYGAAAAGATFTHFKIQSSATPGSGTVYYTAPLTGGSQTVSTGTSVSFATGALCVNED